MGTQSKIHFITAFQRILCQCLQQLYTVTLAKQHQILNKIAKCRHFSVEAYTQTDRQTHTHTLTHSLTKQNRAAVKRKKKLLQKPSTKKF